MKLALSSCHDIDDKRSSYHDLIFHDQFMKDDLVASCMAQFMPGRHQTKAKKSSLGPRLGGPFRQNGPPV